MPVDKRSKRSSYEKNYQVSGILYKIYRPLGAAINMWEVGRRWQQVGGVHSGGGVSWL